jgi:hypothetical protein
VRRQTFVVRALIRITAWERKTLWRRLVCAFARVGLLIGIVMVLFVVFAPTCVNILMKRKLAGIPGMDRVVQPLADYSVSEAPGTTLSYGGFELEVPWNSTFKTKGKGRIQAFNFASGPAVILWIAKNQDGFLTESANDPSLHMEGLRAAFPELLKQPAYDQYAVLLNITPASIRPFGPVDEAARETTLLMLKAITVSGDIKSGVYSFQLPDKRGFQLGNPAAVPHLRVEIFDLNGPNVEILLAAKDSNSRFTQFEVNRIVRTLHAVPQRESDGDRSKAALERQPKGRRG